MPDHAQDDAFIQYLLQTGMARADQIEAARAAQSMELKKVSLPDLLVKQGVITDAQRKAVEQKLQGLTQLGAYKLLGKLGEGGMGAVYLADDTIGQRQVALKVLPKKLASNEQFVKRFHREAKAIGALNHPNIVNAICVGEEQGNHFLVMEFCDGQSLDRVLQQRRHLEVDEAVKIVAQVARGLQHAHSHGIVHRDIKPANILLAKDGSAKILDLGLSKRIEENDNSFVTQAGMAVGTPHYISPEQARGKNVDARTDIYSLGATFYHLITGHTPFSGSNGAAIMLQHINEQIANPQDLRPDISDSVVHVIQKMMGKLPDDRYANCAELLADLEAICEGRAPSSHSLEAARSTINVRRASPVPAAKRTHARAPSKPGSGTTAVFACLGVVGLAAIMFALSNRGREEPVRDKEKTDGEKLTLIPAGARQVEKKSTDAPLVATEPKSEPKADAKPTSQSAPAKNGIDLLKMIDPAKDVVAGKWKLESGELSCTDGDFNRIEIPVRPPDEYDFTITFTRHEGTDVNQIIVRRDKGVLWQMGGWGNKYFCFELVDDKPGNESPHAVKKDPCLEHKRKYTSRVEVRNDGIKTFLDGKLIVDLKTDFSNVEIYKRWKLRDPSLLGLATHAAVTFHSVELVEVTGKARPVR